MNDLLKYCMVFGPIFFWIPWISIGVIAALMKLHFKYGISLWWVAIPALVFIFWVVVMWAVNRR